MASAVRPAIAEEAARPLQQLRIHADHLLTDMEHNTQLLQSQKEAIGELGEQLGNITNLYHQAVSDKQQIEMQNSHNKQVLARLEQKVGSLEGNLANLLEQINDAQHRTQRAERGHAAVNQELEEAIQFAEEMVQKNLELQSKIERGSEQLLQEELKSKKLQSHVQEMTDNVADQEAKLEAAAEEARKAAVALKLQEENISALQMEKEDLDRDLRTKTAQYSSLVEIHASEVAQAEEQRQEAEQRIQVAKDKSEKLREEVARLMQAAGCAMASIESQDKQSRGAQQSVDEVNCDIQCQLENMVQATAAKVEELQQLREGEAKKHAEELMRLTSEIKTMEDKHAQYAEGERAAKQHLEKQTSEQINKLRAEKDAALKWRDGKICHLQQQMESCHNEIEALTKLREEAQGELEAKEAKLCSARAAHDILEQELSGTTKENKKLAAELEEARSAREVHVEEKQEMLEVVKQQAHDIACQAKELEAARRKMAAKEITVSQHATPPDRRKAAGRAKYRGPVLDTEEEDTHPPEAFVQNGGEGVQATEAPICSSAQGEEVVLIDDSSEGKIRTESLALEAGKGAARPAGLFDSAQAKKGTKRMAGSKNLEADFVDASATDHILDPTQAVGEQQARGGHSRGATDSSGELESHPEGRNQRYQTRAMSKRAKLSKQCAGAYSTEDAIETCSTEGVRMMPQLATAREDRVTLPAVRQSRLAAGPQNRRMSPGTAARASSKAGRALRNKQPAISAAVAQRSRSTMDDSVTTGDPPQNGFARIFGAFARPMRI